jgi:alkylation response protein AidB-like acyl-CoA dehydrogenase
MAVRTGPEGSGAAGLSILVVPLKNQPGVTMRHLKVGGSACAGTTYIELDDVKVPVENLIGKEGMVRSLREPPYVAIETAYSGSGTDCALVIRE